MTSFTDTLLANLDGDMEPGSELIALMRWLEDDQNGLMHYTSTNAPFLPTTPVADITALWSHVAFVHEPTFFTHWLGRDDLHNDLACLVRCGGDGSHMALWRDPAGGMKYVFCGSEGAAFTLTDNALDFVRLLVMGYVSIEDRDVLTQHPAAAHAEYSDAPWPDTPVAKDWLHRTFAAQVPVAGADLIPDGPDPFPAWIDANTGYR
ncbi:hypothetical protein [Sulfitobacter sp. JB4-11]|uniref:hypothetical protein n=1 Tax=Sulfitobacter rhodophyticola TaxID=3238304 RepID=UPI003A6EB8C2